MRLARLTPPLLALSVSLAGCDSCRAKPQAADAGTTPRLEADQGTAASKPAGQPAPGLLGGERGLDHLGLAVSDLDAAKLVYLRLGFDRPVRGRLPNGIDNVNFYFEDATYLELLTAYDDKKAAWLAKFTSRFTSGGVFLVLSVRSMDSTAAFLKQRGVGFGAPVPGRIEVGGKPGGSWQTMFLDRGALPGNPIYFIEYPAAKRRAFLAKLEDPQVRRSVFRHRNTATGIKAAWMAVKDLDAAARSYERLGLKPGRLVELPRIKARGRLVAGGPSHEILLVAPATDDSPVAAFNKGRGPGVFGMSISVKSLIAAKRVLRDAGLKPTSAIGPLGKSLVLPPAAAAGTYLELFEPAVKTR